MCCLYVRIANCCPLKSNRQLTNKSIKQGSIQNLTLKHTFNDNYISNNLIADLGTMDRKKCLIANVIGFLTQEITDSNLSEERKESVEVAIQCLETAYEVSAEVREKAGKIDLLASIPVEEDISEENKQKAEVHKAFGNNAMKTSNFQLAVDEYTMAINSNPKNAIYHCNRAAAFSRLDKQYEAIVDCKQAITLDPNYGKAYGRLGIAYSNLKMYAEAKQAYSTALKLDPTNQMYETNMNLAEEKLREYATGSQAANVASNLSIFNNDAFVRMAREMMSHPQFYELVNGVLQTPGTNFDNMLQLGQDFASALERDPGLAENMVRAFENQAPPPTPPQQQQQQQNPSDNQPDSENKNNNDEDACN